MYNYKKLHIAKASMFLINFVIILFMTTLVFEATQMICLNNKARDFLDKISYVPVIPWKIPFFSAVLMLFLLFSTIIREKLLKDNKPVRYLFIIMDLIICAILIYYTNLSYKGIMLLAIMNIITSVEGIRRRNLFIAAAIIIFIIFDYDIISLKLNIFPINEYIQYFSPTQRLYIYSIRNVLSSINEVLFIIFMIFVIQRQVDENKEIKGLYERLYKTAEELKIANIQLQQYTKQSEEMVKMRERNRLAREIHDTIGHTLTAIATGIEACSELINWDLEKTKTQLSKISHLARNGLLDVRRSVGELRPDALERFSLVPAIRELADNISGCTNTKVNLNICGDVRKLREDEEDTIYRVIQEGITNAVRHGNASEIVILLNYGSNSVSLEITDDGVGCTGIKEGFGLVHIKERVELLKGSVRFDGEGGNGFRIQTEIPVRWG